MKRKCLPDVAAHIYNPNYLGGKDGPRITIPGQPRQNYQEPISINKPDVVVDTYNPRILTTPGKSKTLSEK
jgi:hypothetical protein